MHRKYPKEQCSSLAEAAGLAWLREASTHVAEVVEVDEHSIATRRVEEVRPSAEAARMAGRELARIHEAGAPAFGSPPPGWEGPNYIGTQQQRCEPRDTWLEFYSEQRVLPFARDARCIGTLSAEEYDLVARALDEVVTESEHPSVNATTPARIHGDLWAGNLLFGTQGPVFIDPSAHGGHGETDLAMLALFGAPYLEEVFAGYQEIRALAPDFERFIVLHQLHPLAVHAKTHGRAYGRQLARTADAVLRQLA